MLDTVILRVPKSQYRVFNKERFSLVSTPKNNGVIVCRVYANNATTREKKLNIYRPRLSIVDSLGREQFMNIEFSAQTILFGNTLQEVSELDFGNEVDVLQQSIFEMGVSIEKELLRYANTTTFHPSKNILITGSHSVTGIIRDFTKVNITEKMEIDHKDFKNGGHGVQFRAETHALTFYNKIKDLEKREGKAYSTDQKIQQASLFDFIQQKKKLEVVRMEVRLCEKRKINTTLSGLGFKTDPVFISIFKKDVCRKILLHYFETFIEPNLFIFDVQDDPLAILENAWRKNPKMKPAKAMNLAALKMFCKADGGARKLRRIIESKSSERKWQRIATEIKTLNRRIPLKSCYGYIKEIKQTLQRFKPYKPEVD